MAVAAAHLANTPTVDAMTTAETLRAVAQMVEGLAYALEHDDEIMGSISGQGLANHLPALPKHVRDVFAEYLTDEAARSYRADLAYLFPDRETVA
jgi:hypothetical protein